MLIKNLHTMRQSQQGVVLIVGLIMVLLISVIALAAIRGSGLQEAMVGNMRGRNIAFQASESAVTDGEDYVYSLTEAVTCDGVVRGRYRCFTDMDDNPDSSVMYFSTDDNDFPSNGNITAMGLTNVYSQPVVVVESLKEFQDDTSDQSLDGKAMRIAPYRVSSLGVDTAGTGKVVLQSTFNREP
jgi:type IV pilus assembly protein PilX